ncbi:thiamine pyrophosphate-dependent enzyme [Desulforhabdus amnigena]|jgi:pyruvate ferredoxin oxidoreductase beta subunit|uniref:2-ketoisovalerate ferredoxin oxidoreductase subunit beta n=1 Tax=Desulforhabdus amnigena TaxID=40218 RepID=A0A9W6D2C3_9BACT|nr:thiamine pyrophosphate-dependent enzyme [Desulforhabdus amnigena]NLJ28383.1 pyruvate synthase subunit beta [Deltaproteobacteria bacterium]GLI34575.1 2-ketoisovalerate ferredoxin oxidoreductase subunit beta [Desulforhabdus amnigena]
MSTTILDLPEREYILPGTRTCAGCGLPIAYRYILKALGPRTIMTHPACCLTILHGIYPKTPIAINAVNNTFASTAASASGLVAGLKATGQDFTVLAMAGDGGTFDMGIQALSGAAERETNFIYVCYDNEAYMNTGAQRSSATPTGAVTTTTPFIPKEQPKKDFIQIMEAHHPAYLATTCSSYPGDLFNKFAKARDIKGTRFIHLAVPCPTGWGFATKDTVKVGRIAVETGVVVLYEVENGEFRLTGKSLSMARSGRKRPAEEYLKLQSRFKKMTPEQMADFQRQTDERWEQLLKRAGL